VIVECALNIGNRLVWEYPFWRLSFGGVWLIFLFGYFEFSEIKELLASPAQEDGDLAGFLARKAEEISRKAEHYRNVKREIDLFLAHEKEMQMLQVKDIVEEKMLDDVLIAGLRFHGKYEDVGKRIGELARVVGRFVAGGAFSLYYDAEYKEEDADIEVALPVRKPVRAQKVDCRILTGGCAVTVIHRGPYSEVGHHTNTCSTTWARRAYPPVTPSREVYLKGPAMLIAGNPRKYLTELQVLVK
jgi:effector-binding domain-containing protein